MGIPWEQKKEKKSISTSPPSPERKCPEPLGCIASLSEQKFLFLHLFVTIFDLVSIKVGTFN
jgi:hypothetical protein